MKLPPPRLFALLPACMLVSANAASVFWDVNGATADGSNGTTADGIWSTADANWSTSSAGTAATAAWTAGDNALFSAGSNVTGASAVTVTGTQSLGTLTIQEGNVTFGGDALSFSGSALTASSGASATFNNNLQFGIATTLTGSLALNGGASIGNVTLTLGNATTVTLNSTITHGGGASSRLLNIGTAQLNITGGGITAASAASSSALAVGNGASQGSVRQSGGSVNLGPGALWLGNVTAGSHGAYSLGGSGTLSGGNLLLGASSGSTTGNQVTATYEQTGGSATFTRTVIGFSSSASAASSFTLTGGTFTFNGLNSASNIFSVGGSGRGELNVSGTGVLDFSGGVGVGRILYLGETATGNGVANLGTGGLVKTFQVAERNASATSLFNFNGGTLQATAANTDFIAVDNTFVHSGGARIDTNGFNVTVAKTLQAPAGDGVQSVAVTNGGSGFTGAPVVSITGGGGTGATGYAVMDSTGTQVVSIVITNPGTGYTSAPTVTLVGGGGSGAVLGTASLAAVTSGALTKIGSGVLTLSAANTYAGGTFINAGGITTSGLGALGTGNVTVSSGASLTLGNTSSIADSAILFFSTGASITNSAGTESLGNIVLGSTSITLSGLYSASDLNTFFGLTGGSEVFFGSGFYDIAAVSVIPEPATGAVIAGGLMLGVALLGRRRRPLSV
jgi:hypothetical protein